MPTARAALKTLLDQKVEQYERPGFIPQDPVQVPHRFVHLPDVEIMAFFAAVLAWGQRVTIINKCHELIGLFGGQPHHFMLHHTSDDLKRLEGFCHRTFNSTDLLYFVHFFHHYYQKNETLETAFSQFVRPRDPTVEAGLAGFHHLFFALPDAPARTRKHVATPARQSACKRLNMFLRWMVRPATGGVDFGLWQRLRPAQLVCPLDVHVERVARRLGLLARKASDWQAALELTANLRRLDRQDPVRYDFALFGLGLEENGKVVVSGEGE
jgi:uncharacterized protein (TIGR02757 family)